MRPPEIADSTEAERRKYISISYINLLHRNETNGIINRGDFC